jgi:hypothetical protein
VHPGLSVGNADVLPAPEGVRGDHHRGHRRDVADRRVRSRSAPRSARSSWASPSWASSSCPASTPTGTRSSSVPPADRRMVNNWILRHASGARS